MVAIVAGNGLGLFNASSSILGGAGVLGRDWLGQAGGRAIVNVANGNLLLQVQDEQLSGRGLDLRHLRTYNSLGSLTDGDADGWRWYGERRLRVQGTIGQVGSKVFRTDGDGHETQYDWDGSRYMSTEGGGAHDTLVFESSTQQWVWKDGSSRLEERYGASAGANEWRLMSQKDTSGNAITFGYDGSGRLTSIVDAGSGQKIELVYGPVSGNSSLTRLQSVNTYALTGNGALGAATRQVEYDYDTFGRLTSVKTDLKPGDNSTADGAVYVTSYTYDGTSTRVASVTQSDGTHVRFTYDSANRIRTVTDGSGTQTFTYSVSGDVETGVLTYRTDVSIDVGDGKPKVWSYISDDAQRLTEILSPAPTPGGARLSTKFHYDADGNVDRVTDARGNTVVYEYDSQGNRILERDALGNTVRRTYDSANQLITETRYRTPDPDGAGSLSASDPLTTRYVYDSQSRLRFVISPEGRVVENRYGTGTNDSGLLRSSIKYAASAYDLGDLEPGDALTLEDLEAWAATANKSKVTLTQLFYDPSGNISRQVSFASVAASGVGVLDAAATVTEYVYDAHGQLLQTIAVRGSARDQRTTLSSRVYDGLGRELQVVDSSGTRTTVYDDANRRIEVTTSAGLLETRSYDTNGRLVSISRSGSGSARAAEYVYDAVGQLRMTEDAQGGRRFSFYDAAGRLQFSVDSTGAVIGFEYDQNGLVTAETRYFNRVSTSGWFDGTTVTRHALALGTDVIAHAAHDRVTRYTYDAANRLTTQTDAANSVTTTRYDGVSQVTMTQKGDRVARFLYDGDGRRVGLVDALGYLTEYKYDAGGRLVETVRYGARSPTAANTTAPLWIGVTNQTAIGGQAFEYRVPAYDADGDALTYSVVGNLPSWLQLDATGGTPKLRGTPPKILTSYSVTLRASDQRGKTSDVTIAIAVVNSAPSWGELQSSRVPVNADGWADFSLTLPAASDNESAASQLTYSIRSALPSGVTFDAAARRLNVTGLVPRGVYTITARVTDSHGAYVDKTFTLTMTGDGASWSQWAPVPAQSARVGQQFSMIVSAAEEPQGLPLTYSIVSGPSWLTFDPATRELRGTPPAGAPAFGTVVLRAERAGRSVLLAFDLSVNKPTPSWESLSPLDLVAGGIAGHVVPAATGESLTYSVVGGLPPGLSFNAATRTITGSSSAVGFYTIVLRATDASGQSIERTLSLQIRSNAGSSPQSSGTDPLSAWRPASGATLRSHVYYDGQDRVVGAVDERGFLSEIVYDEHANSQKSVSYSNAVTVGTSDTLSTLKNQVGSARLTATVEYDDFGRVKRTIGVDGTATLNEYDESGRLVRETRAVGTDEARAKLIRYNAFGEITGMVGGEGAASGLATDAAIAQYGLRYEYDSLGRRTRAIDANGRATLFFYDSESRLTHTVNAAGEVSETIHDTFGQVTAARRYATRMMNLAGLTGGPASQLQGRLPAHDAAKDEVTSYEHDRRGLVIKQTDAEGFVTTRSYTQFGELAAEVRSILQGRTVTTQYDYDQRGALVALTRDAGGINFTARTVYDGFGRVVESIDAAGNVTKTTYEDSGRTIETSDPLNRAVRHEYDAQGRVVVRVDALGNRTSYAYDDTDRSFTVTTPEGVEVTTRRTRHGEVLEVMDGRGNTVSYQYDKDGRLKRVTDALGRVTTDNEYDKSGRLFEVTDARGTVVRFDYDAVDRVIERRVDPDGLNLRTTYRFDALARQIEVTEGHGSGAPRVTSYQYDRKGQLEQVIVDPTGLQLSTRYTLDGIGNTVKVERGTVGGPAQHVVVYEFDALGRRIKEIAAPSALMGAGPANARGLTTEYRYDAAGRLSRKIDASGQSTWYVYDAAGQLTHTINAEGELTQSSYDANGRVVQTRRYLNRLSAGTLATFGDVVSTVAPIAHANDQRVHVVYDADGRQRFTVQAAQDTNWIVTEKRYDANGNVIESRRYDRYLPESRVNAIDTASSPGLSVEEIDAELAALGYDESAGKLAKVQRTRFAYDANNRLRFTVDALGSVTENVYDRAGAVVASVRYAARPTLPDYDERGIGAAVDRGDRNNQVRHFAFDAAGRLRFSVQVLASDAQGVATQHVVSESRYDALGRVVHTISFATAVGAVASYGESALADASKSIAGIKDRQTAFAYDAAGRQVYSVRVLSSGAQGSHLVSRQEYDALDRIVKTTAFATAVGLSDFTHDTIAAAVDAAASARDRTTSFVYDAAGRQRFIVAADGSLSETVYDALGQVRETRRFDLKVDTQTPRTEAALIERRSSRAVGDNVTRGEKYTYDRVGRRLTTTDARGFVETNEYNALGDRTSLIDKKGSTWTYHYDRQGRVFRQVAPAVLMKLSSDPVDAAPTLRVREDRFYRDAFGNLIQKVEALGTSDVRTTDYAYDTLGRLEKTTLHGFYNPGTGKVDNAGGGARFRRDIEVAYDALGNAVRTKTRTADNTFVYEYKAYDTLGRLVYDVDVLNHVTAFTYTAFGEQQTVTRHSVTVSGQPASATHWTAAELAGKVAADAAARTTTTTYDNVGRKIEVRQPQASSYFFSLTTAQNNASQVQAASAQAITQFEYDAFGQLHREQVKIDASRWRDIWHYYDVMGRETRTIDALGHQSARSYDAFGNLDRSVEYSKAGETGKSGEFAPPDAIESEDDRITGYVYNALNQQTSVLRFGLRFSSWNGSTYVEAKKGRDEATTVRSLAYDAIGKVETATDALNNSTHFEYNALGQLVETTEPARPSASLGTDPFRNQVTATPVTTLTLDAFGNVVMTERNPGGGKGDVLITRQVYDAAGNAIKSIDANGNEMERRYDYAGRLTHEKRQISVFLGNDLGGHNTHTLERRYSYDATGRQIAVLDVYFEGAAGLQSGKRNVFNAFGEVTEELRVWGSYALGLDSLENRKVARYEYDSAGQRTAKFGADGETHYFYDLTGQVTRQELRGNGSDADQTTTRTIENGYDLLGRAVIRRMPHFVAQVPNGAGMAGRTVTAFTTQGYDRWGNVTQRTSGGYVGIDNTVDVSQQSVVLFTYNHDNKVVVERLPVATVSRANGGTYLAQVTHELQYDVLGRSVLERDVTDNVLTLSNEAEVLRTRTKRFDAVGNVVAETDATGITTQYAYDAHGRRVGKKNALGTVFIETFDKNGNVLSQGVLRLANGQPYVSSPTAPTPVLQVLKRFAYDQADRRYRTDDVGVSSGGVAMTRHDERNQVRAQRNAGGAITTYGYDEFGNRTSEVDTLGNTESWVYNRNDFSIGQLSSSTAGGKTTTYGYNDFGQLALENHAGLNNERRYVYHANGLLKRIDDLSTAGTKGVTSGADYMFANDSTQYDYTVEGRLARERFTRTGEQDVRKHTLNEGWTYSIEVLEGITRTVYTQYDAQGRMTRVWAPDEENSGNTLSNLSYHYDELGNIRHIASQYKLTSTSTPGQKDLWYTYDAEGRMTMADGVLTNGVIQMGQSGTRITYDGLGRRATAERFARTSANPPGTLPGTWKEYREERYGYNDLSHLNTVSQRLNRRERTFGAAKPPDEVGVWHNAETRETDSLGYVTSHVVWQDVRGRFIFDGNAAEFVVDAPARKTTTTSEYRDDGQLHTQSTTHHADSTGQSNSHITLSYDAAGKLTHRFYRQGLAGTPQEFVDTYAYTYSMEAGGAKEKTVTVTRSGGNPNMRPGDTTNVYDSRGRLLKTVIQNAQESTTRTFAYDSSDRIFTVRQTGYALNGGASPVGRQEHFYADGRQVATLGTGALDAARFSFAFTPISAANPNPSMYTVRSGDTLAGIAQAVYGDRSLWYLIADANSLGYAPEQALPGTEIGKSYRIPSVVGSGNNATTFKAYNAAEIIGNTTPRAMPLANEQCTGTARALASVIVVAVTLIVSTAVTSGMTALGLGPVLGGSLGGAAGSLSGQTVGWALGLQDGIDWEQVGVAGAQGAVSGGLSKVLKGADAATRVARAGVGSVANQIVSQAVNNFEGWSSEGAVQSSLFNVGLSMATSGWGHHLDSEHFNWSRAASQIAGAAFNPQSGWLFNDRSRDWAQIATQAASAVASVTVGGALSWLRERGSSDSQGPQLTHFRDGLRQWTRYWQRPKAERAWTLGAGLTFAGGWDFQASGDEVRPPNAFFFGDLYLNGSNASAAMVSSEAQASWEARFSAWVDWGRRWQGRYASWERQMVADKRADWATLQARRDELPDYLQEFTYAEDMWASGGLSAATRTNLHILRAQDPSLGVDAKGVVTNSEEAISVESKVDPRLVAAMIEAERRDLLAYQDRYARALIIAEEEDLHVLQVMNGEHEYGIIIGTLRNWAEPLAIVRDGFIGTAGEDGKLYSQYAKNIRINRRIREEVEGKSGGGWAEVKIIADGIASAASGVNPYTAAAYASYSTGNLLSNAIDNGGFSKSEVSSLLSGVSMAGGLTYATSRYGSTSINLVPSSWLRAADAPASHVLIDHPGTREISGEFDARRLSNPQHPQYSMEVELGRGDLKTAYEVTPYGEGPKRVLGVLNDPGRLNLLQQEIAALRTLEQHGIPATRTYGITTYGGRPAGVYEPYAVNSKALQERYFHGDPAAVSPLLNRRSVSDIDLIQQRLRDQKIYVDDLQLGIHADGRVEITDPLGLRFGMRPDIIDLEPLNTLRAGAEANRTRGTHWWENAPPVFD